MRPDGVRITPRCLTLTGIKHINLLHFLVAIPVIISKVHLSFHGVTGVNDHLCRVFIIAFLGPSTVKLRWLRERNRTNDIEREVERTVTLVEEIVVNTTYGVAFLILIARHIQHMVIQSLDILLRSRLCPDVSRVPELRILELNEDHQALFLPCPRLRSRLSEGC